MTLESAKELPMLWAKGFFSNIVKKCQMPNLDSIKENVKRSVR